MSWLQLEMVDIIGYSQCISVEVLESEACLVVLFHKGLDESSDINLVSVVFSLLDVLMYL